MIDSRFIARLLLPAAACLASCTSGTRVQVADFGQPLRLDQSSASDSSSIVGLALEISGQAAQPITVKVRCRSAQSHQVDPQIQQFEVSGRFTHRAKMDAYSNCAYMVFESTSFVGSTMTVTYTYTTL
jgi:hypothetical protein